VSSSSSVAILVGGRLGSGNASSAHATNQLSIFRSVYLSISVCLSIDTYTSEGWVSSSSSVAIAVDGKLVSGSASSARATSELSLSRSSAGSSAAAAAGSFRRDASADAPSMVCTRLSSMALPSPQPPVDSAAAVGARRTSSEAKLRASARIAPIVPCRKSRGMLSIPIDSPCECEHTNPDSLDARLFPLVVFAVAPAVTMDEASSVSIRKLPIDIDYIDKADNQLGVRWAIVIGSVRTRVKPPVVPCTRSRNVIDLPM